MQRSVFVEVREAVEDGKAVTIRVRSVVRLQLLDCCNHFRRYGSDLPGFKILNTSGDGESAIPPHLGRENAALMSFPQEVDEGVKAARRLCRMSLTMLLISKGGYLRTWNL